MQNRVWSLLKKAGKDQLYIKNWHPLTSGFLKGRFIAKNLMDLNTVITSVNLLNVPSVIMAVDFEKAYDTLE